MATIAVVLKTKQKLSNGEFAVALRVTHDRHSRFIVINTLLTDQSLKLRCPPEEWKPAEAEDNGLGRFRKTFKGYKECNAILETKLVEAHKILRRYESEGIPFDFIRFEGDLKKKETVSTKEAEKSTSKTSVQDYYTRQIQILEEQGRVGLAGLYLEVQLILKKFKPNALLADINIRFLESFEYWMRNQRGNKDTTISVKMRNLQRVINQAYLGRTFDDKRELLREVIRGTYKLAISYLKLEDKKLYLLATFEQDRQVHLLSDDVVAEASLSLEHPLIVKIGRLRLTIGNKEEFLYRRLAIQAARRRVQASHNLNRAGHGKKRKQKPSEHYKHQERLCRIQLQVYSWRLIDFCVKYQAATLILTGQLDKEEAAKEETFVLRNWSYGKLKDKIAYKAHKAGINLIVE
jgi:hypothetical protein